MKNTSKIVMAILGILAVVFAVLFLTGNGAKDALSK